MSLHCRRLLSAAVLLQEDVDQDEDRFQEGFSNNKAVVVFVPVVHVIGCHAQQLPLLTLAASAELSCPKHFLKKAARWAATKPPNSRNSANPKRTEILFL